MKKTGIDPVAMAQENTSPAGETEAVETGMRRGLFHGLVMGTIRGGDFAAATPAGAGALMALRRHRKAMEEQHEAYQQAYAARAQKLKTYDSAYGACIQGRGYTVN